MNIKPLKSRKRTGVFVTVFFLTLLIIASFNNVSLNTLSEASQAYMPRFPSMLRLWESIPLEGKPLGTPESYGSYVAYLYASYNKPVLAIVDIISDENTLIWPIEIPSYLGTNLSIDTARISWFSWNYYGKDVTGLVLVIYTKDISGTSKSIIVSIPDVFGESIPFRTLYVPSSGVVKGFTIHEKTLYVLESSELGRYSLRAIDLVNGKTLWTFLSSEFVTPDWRLIESHYTRFSSIAGEKDVWDLYENYAIIYKPLYEALSNLEHTVIYSNGKLFISLPFGPLLMVNATEGTLIKGDVDSIGWALSPTADKGIIRDIQYPMAIKYTSSTGEEYIVTFSVLANYGRIIADYMNRTISVPIGDLRGHLKITIYSTSSGEVLSELDVTNMTEISDLIKYSITTIMPMTSFYVKLLSPAIFSQGLAYDYSWIFGTKTYVQGIEQNIEDKIASISPPKMNEPEKPVMYLFTMNHGSIMPSFSKISLNSGDEVLKAYAFRALGYKIYYYLNDGNETYAHLNMREVVLTIRKSGMFAYGISESQDISGMAELNLIWAWKGYIPIDVVKIGKTVWGLLEEFDGSYYLRIVSPIYISAGSPSIGELGGTLNALDMGYSFYDYLTGEWIPHLPRHLWGYIFYQLPNGEVYSMGSNTTIFLTSPGMNTIRAMMLFNDTLEISTNNLGKELLTKILLFDTGIADESFVDVFVLAKNYWPSKHGGLESYNFAYDVIPNIMGLEVTKVEGISLVNERIVGVLSKQSHIYVITAGESFSHVYVISPDQMATLESTEIEGKATSAAIFRDKLFVLTQKGMLYEYDGNSVSLRTYIPWIDESAILESSSSGLYLFDLDCHTLAKLDEFGRIVWIYSFKNAPKAFTYGLGHIFVADTEGTIYAIYDEDGSTTWERNIGKAGDVKYVLIPHSADYPGTSYIAYITEDGRMLVISPINGSTILEKDIFKLSTEKLLGNVVYVPTTAKLYVVSNYYVYEINAKSLEVRDILKMPAYVRDNNTTFKGPIANTDTLFFLTGQNGRIIAMKISEGAIFFNEIKVPITNPENMILNEPFIFVSNETEACLVGIPPVKVLEKSLEDFVIRPGEEALIKVMVRDPYGNPINNTPITVETPPEISLLSNNLTTDENGVATIRLTGYKAGEYEITIGAEVEGKEYTIREILTIYPGEPAHLELEIQKNTIYAGEPIGIMARVEDSYGNPIEGVEVEAYANYGKVSPKTVITNPNGEAAFTYTSKVAGIDTITVRALGYDLYATKTIEVLPGEPHIVNISIDSEIILGGTYTAEISVFDRYGNAVSAGYNFNIYVDNSSVAYVTTDGYGKAKFTYTFTEVGMHTIKAVWNENPSVYGRTSFNVIYGPPAKIVIEEMTSKLKAGETFGATVIVLNKFEHPIPNVEVEVYLDSMYLETLVTDSGGRVNISKSITAAGIHTVKIVIAKDPNLYKQALFEVLPSEELSLTVALNKKEITAGEELVITMVLEDVYGNAVKKNLIIQIGDLKDMCTVGPDPVKYKTILTKAGNYNLIIKYEGKTLYSDVIVVKPSAPTKIASPRNITFEAGEVREVVVRVYDEYDNPVPQTKIYAITTSEAPMPYNYQAITDDEGKATLAFNFTKAGVYNIRIYLEENHEVFTTITLTVLPGKVDKIVYPGPDKTYAGTKTEVSFIALDKYDNPICLEKITITAPKELTLSEVPLTTDGEGKATFYIYGEKIGKYTITITFPRYNQSYYLNITFLPAEEKIITIEIGKTVVKPGEEVVVIYTLSDIFGNPVIDAIPQLKYEGVQIAVKSVTPSDSSGVGYFIIMPQSKGFGKIYVEYEGYSSTPIDITSGNPTLLKIENWLAEYWYILIILVAMAIVGVLLAIYIRTIRRFRKLI